MPIPFCSPFKCRMGALRTLLLFPIMILMLAGLTSCGDGSEGVLSLKIGNQWIGRYRAHTDTEWQYDTMRIVRDTVIDGDTWYRMERRIGNSKSTYRPISQIFRGDAWLTNSRHHLYEWREDVKDEDDRERLIYLENDDLGEHNEEQGTWLVADEKAPRPYLVETNGLRAAYWDNITVKAGEYHTIPVEYRSKYADTEPAPSGIRLPWGKAWIADGVGKVMETWHMLAPDGTLHNTGMWELVSFTPAE